MFCFSDPEYALDDFDSFDTDISLPPPPPPPSPHTQDGINTPSPLHDVENNRRSADSTSNKNVAQQHIPHQASDKNVGKHGIAQADKSDNDNDRQCIDLRDADAATQFDYITLLKDQSASDDTERLAQDKSYSNLVDILGFTPTLPDVPKRSSRTKKPIVRFSPV